MESVTKSEQVAKSICVASDNRNTGSRAVIESSTLHPASAIYPSASDASVAVLVVAFPISRAASSNRSKSVSDALAIAAVFAMACSNDE